MANKISEEKKAGSRLQRKIFGKNFRAARLQAGLKQRDICEMTGMNAASVCNIESGRHVIGVGAMSIMADIVNVPLWQLLKPGE